MSDDQPVPHQRENIIGRAELEAALRESLREGALSHGWLIAGPPGAGKATLAYRLARALLDPAALCDDASLRVGADSKVFRLIAGEAHPDLFVAARRYDEKKDRHQTEISVDTVRDLNHFLNQTAGFGGWRVAIVDTADDLNRNAANALLKSLEEPPPRTAILLCANAPGRLLATIRSRCRRIDLRPVADAEIIRLLMDEAGLDERDARAVAAAAHGRPGYALTLAAGEGREAIAAVEAFLSASLGAGDVGRVAAALTGKAAAERWTIFKDRLMERLRDAARAGARGEEGEGALAGMAPATLLVASERLGALLERGDALNLDRRDLILAMGRTLHAAALTRAA
ncbi:MAG: DNA polymerase III subunit delta' [Alphaproteobacteria bacterium]|nr:DNA polymerase III subunit delta' [Alphaproteobacteria bacterium]